MPRIPAAMLALLAGLGISTLEAGFRARMIPCGCFSPSTGTEPQSTVGAVAGIGGAIAGAEAGGRGVIETAADPVAERWAWRRRIIRARRCIHLRDHGRRNLRRWRRRRQIE